MSVTVRRFESAADARAFEKGRFDVIDLAGLSVGRARYEPGWRWSTHVGAPSGQASCPVEHVCLVLEGRACIRMDDGEEVVVGPGDLFHCPAGHDSWVVGDAPYVSLHFLGASEYAKKQAGVDAGGGMSDERSVRIAWDDPGPLARAARETSGLEFLSRIVRGELPWPPIGKLLDMGPIEVSEGRAVFKVVPGEQHYNPIGGVHGGLLATALDSTMACAVHSTLPAGTGYTTVELHVNLVRAVVKETGPLRAEGEIVHRGSRVATAQGRVVDGSGRLYAHGTTTCLIVT